MEIDFFFSTYESGDGISATLNLVEAFLNVDAPDFGNALTKIKLHAFFRSVGPPRRFMEDAYTGYHEKSFRNCPNIDLCERDSASSLTMNAK